MIDLYALSADELTALLKAWGQPAFRAKQVRNWLYERGASSFEQMTNLPAALREKLAQETCLGDMSIALEQTSRDGTIKRLYQLHDGQLVEAVLMPYEDGRRTACISSQAGCAMGCVFCATGQMGFSRQLTEAEIFGQAMLFARDLMQKDERLSNIVFMGMGEPFHNYKNVRTSLDRLMGDLGIGARHLTVSTVGLVPQIRQFAEEGIQVKLAISLHKTRDDERSRLMPVNKRFNIGELIEACRYYVEKTSRRVTFEWALIAGENDSAQQARELAALLKGLICHVNVIPLNPTGGYAGNPSDREAVDRFVKILNEQGTPATIRVRRGIDIDAGCGQLKSKVLRKQEREANGA